MSDDSNTSPSLLNNLRQYRFQKKPSKPTTEDTSTADSNETPNTEVSNGRKRIITMPDSESENDTSKNEPATPKKDPDVKTKERHLRILAGEFPHIDTMSLQDALMKAGWDSDLARPACINFVPKARGFKRSYKYQSGGETSSYNNSNGSSNMQKKKRFKRNNDSDDSDAEAKKEKEKVFDSDEDSDVELSDDLTGDRKKVFDFLNTGTANELALMASCSQKKVDNILSLRPFKGWVDLVDKFQENKYLNTDLLNSAQDVLVRRNNVMKLMKKCSAMAQQVEAAVTAGAGVNQQPSILTEGLKLGGYQLIGLNWLVVMHKQRMNSILADEMGLGKTVQVIAFLAHLKETGEARGTHLIVVPASTLDNWKQEFERWCPSMEVVVYYGTPDERKMFRIDWSRGGLDGVDVVLTTYTLVSSGPEERKMFRVTQMHYVVFDEAHMLKNMATQRYENLIRIKAQHRILLTGTPLQNNLLELMSLLAFVMPSLFAGQTDDLKSLFQKAKGSSKKNEEDRDLPPFEQSQISQAKKIMKPFVLRRLKRDVMKDLPPKTDHTVQVPMIESQQQKYANLIKSFSTDTGEVHANSENSGMSMMMDMRKLSNHPLLLRYYYDESKIREIAKRLAEDPFHKEKNAEYLFTDLLYMSDYQIHQLTFEYKSICGMKLPQELMVQSGKFAYLDEMLPKLKSEDHRVLIFSQFTMMLDIVESYLNIRNHRFIRLDGSTAVTSRQELIDKYNSDPEIFIFLLSTKAGGLGINLTAADTVIIHDIDFNPYNDKQAEDRCHRMGQTRPVKIYRLISEGTIEEGIYQVAKEKLNLEKEVTNDKGGADEPQEMKNVVRLLTLALGLDSNRAANLLSPSSKKKS